MCPARLRSDRELRVQSSQKIQGGLGACPPQKMFAFWCVSDAISCILVPNSSICFFFFSQETGFYVMLLLFSSLYEPTTRTNKTFNFLPQIKCYTGMRTLIILVIRMYYFSILIVFHSILRRFCVKNEPPITRHFIGSGWSSIIDRSYSVSHLGSAELHEAMGFKPVFKVITSVKPVAMQ